jgi:hypothetical protein
MKLGMPQMWDDGCLLIMTVMVNGHWNLPLANNSWAQWIGWGKHPETMELPLDPIRRLPAILPNIGGWRWVHLENRGFTRNGWFLGECTNQKCGLFRLKQVVFTWDDGKQNGLKQQNSCMCCHQKMVHSAKPHQKDCKVGKVGWCAHAFMDYWHWVENHQKMCVSGHLL